MATILVIDDEVELRRAASAVLRKAGYSVVEAGDASAALRATQSAPPDLIISDICMPGDDGVTLLKTIRAQTETATVPFLFMSGHANHETMLLGAEHGADGIIPKPFTTQTLLSAVAKRLNREVLTRQRTEEIRLQLLNILEATPDLIALIQPDSHQLVFLNAAGRKMLGLEIDSEVIATRLETIHAPEKAREFAEALKTAIAKGIWTGETVFQTLAGRKFPVREYLQAHREANGACAYLSVIAHDLTESKRLEEERKVMQLQLTHAHKLESIGQLAAGIAHEINTPTQYIGDNTRFLQESFNTLNGLVPKYRELLAAAKSGSVPSAILDEVTKADAEADLDFLMSEIPLAVQQSLEGLDRVTKIVRAMKDFSHPGVNEKTPIDLNHAIESTVTVARNEWKYVAELKLNLDPALPPVPCLPGEINQLVLNLVVNAAHAIADVVATNPDTKGTITVSTRRVENSVEVLVEDTGGGIPEAIRSRIFDPFFTTKEVGKGTGQGLAIARSVMAKHGGTISFDTEVGRGTTFRVSLPLASASDE